MSEHGRSRARTIGVVAVASSLVVFLLLRPLPFELAHWIPPRAADRTGSLPRNDHLAPLERLTLGGAVGPEDVAQDDRGRVYVGVADGRILRFAPERPDESLEVVARTGGRPLGLAFDRGRRRLLVADLRRGLLSVSLDGDVQLLASSAEGVKLGRANDVTVAPDGTIYFTDASSARPDGPAFAALVAHQPEGRLLALNPNTGRARVLADSLYFPNGVTIDAEGSYLLVAEAGIYTIRRVWISGPRAGRSEVFLDNLPGFPDGVTRDSDGLFWIALASPRSALLDALMPHPVLRRALLRIPPMLRPDRMAYGFVLAVDENGTVVHDLQDPRGRYAPISSAVRVGPWLYLGSDRERGLARLRIEGQPSPAGPVGRP